MGPPVASPTKPPKVPPKLARLNLAHGEVDSAPILATSGKLATIRPKSSTTPVTGTLPSDTKRAKNCGSTLPVPKSVAASIS